MKTYLFAYGSLINPESLKKTLPGDHETSPIVLKGYKRVMNFPYEGYAYLNVVANEQSAVTGVRIALTDEEFDILAKREVGYIRTDVTEHIAGPFEGTVYAYIAHNVPCEFKTPLSYLMTCTRGMTNEERAAWINDTVIGEIEDDLEKPVYNNYA